MAVQINQIVKTLLQKDSIEECSLDELQQFAGRYPYFGAAQLLLAKKMQRVSPELYPEQLQKTYLYFNNPLWVEHLLNDTGDAQFHKIPFTIKIDPVSSSTLSNPDRVEEKPVETQRPEPPAANDLLFEPYHMVDYFASQGIRIKEEEKPKDKFGQQLKSFTEWLKVLRKTPSATLQSALPSSEEHTVEKLAQRSLDEKEVLTETMAEVWSRQGNMVKAIEIYTKLSLTEPAKSAYFAAKISALKKNS
jgi:hypothetical protein